MSTRGYRFGNVTLQVDRSYHVPENNLWALLLAPYQTETDQKPQVTVTANSHSMPAGCRLLLREQLGYYDWSVREDATHTLYFTYRRTASNRTCLTFSADPGYSEICLLEDTTDSCRMTPFLFLGKIMPYAMLQHGNLPLHGVLMEYQGQGIILSAPSGTGKTTHARLWRDSKNALIINGDRAICRKLSGVWTGCGYPWSGSSGEQVNRNVPIRAIVVLEQADTNEATHVTALDAFGAVLPNVLCPTWDHALSEKAMDLLIDFLNEIPVIRLQCRPDQEAVETLLQALEAL